MSDLRRGVAEPAYPGSLYPESPCVTEGGLP